MDDATRITFVVKGHVHPESRGIPAIYLNSTSSGETVWETTGRFYGRLAPWFNEEPPLVPGRGYPCGTCLLFSIHDSV